MIIKNNDGVTTIFVILLMVVLLMFGVGVLTITLSSENLAEKKHQWIEEYYGLERVMADELSETNLSLLNIQETLKDDPSFKETYREMISSNFTVYTKDDDLYIELISDQGKNKYLMAELKVLFPDENESLYDFSLKLPFEVIAYLENQDLFDYEDLPFENPFVPNSND